MGAVVSWIMALASGECQASSSAAMHTNRISLGLNARCNSMLSAAVLLGVVVAQPCRAQAQDTTHSLLTAGRGVSIVAGGFLLVAPAIFEFNKARPPCAPCDPQDVIPFDRWVIRPVQQGWAVVGDVMLAGLLAATWADLGRKENGAQHVAASVESVVWTLGLTQTSKAVVGRLRPIMYTDDAVDARTRLTSQRSFPSGHTSAAFALATSYWLSTNNSGDSKRWLVMGAAVAVGVSRVLAAKHFPTDVVAGAALGVGVAIVVREIRF